MMTLNKIGLVAVVVTGLLAGTGIAPGAEQEHPAADQKREHDELVKKDLFAVITLQGHDCGEVVSFERQKQHDYVATCRNGQTFRIYVVPEGRVAVEKK